MTLDRLEKGGTNAIRMTVVALQGLVVVHAGLEMVGNNRRAVILKNVQEHPLQEELGLTVQTPAWHRSRRGVRRVSPARGVIIDQRPLAAIILVSDEEVEGGEHEDEEPLELQEGEALVRVPVDVRKLGSVIRRGVQRTRAGMRVFW